MSRSGYSYDLDNWDLIRWRGAVKAAMHGKRGQAFLREMAAALDAMQIKRLCRDDLENEDGEYCALGAVGRARGMTDMRDADTYDREAIANRFGIAEAMAAEIMAENDEFSRETQEQRWEHVRAWVAAAIKDTP